MGRHRLVPFKDVTHLSRFTGVVPRCIFRYSTFLAMFETVAQVLNIFNSSSRHRRPQQTPWRNTNPTLHSELIHTREDSSNFSGYTLPLSRSDELRLSRSRSRTESQLKALRRTKAKPPLVASRMNTRNRLYVMSARVFLTPSFWWL